MVVGAVLTMGDAVGSEVVEHALEHISSISPYSSAFRCQSPVPMAYYAMAWFVEIGPVSYPDSLFASCGRLPYPYADRSRYVWNPSPSLTDDARVYCICVLLSFSMIIYTFEY